MTTSKTTTLTVGFEANLRQALRKASELEHRSIANMVEVMTRNYYGKIGVKTTKQKALFAQDQIPALRK